MLAKRFFYVSMGILALAVAYHLGASSAGAQAGGPFTGIQATDYGATIAITEGGDIYMRWAEPYCYGTGPTWVSFSECSDPNTFFYMGNVLTGSPTPSKTTSWGSVKGKVGR